MNILAGAGATARSHQEVFRRVSIVHTDFAASAWLCLSELFGFFCFPQNRIRRCLRIHRISGRLHLDYIVVDPSQADPLSNRYGVASTATILILQAPNHQIDVFA